jgi:hypothetical protein
MALMSKSCAQPSELSRKATDTSPGPQGSFRIEEKLDELLGEDDEDDGEEEDFS